MIVVIGGEKGGTGKSTIAVNLAAIAAGRGRDVLLIDTDTQPSSSMWAAIRDQDNVEPRVASIQKSGKGIAKQILDLADRYQEIIIDAGGRDSMELRYALGVAHKAYIPVRPGQFDTWTLSKMNHLVEESQAFNPSLEAYLLISCASPNMLIQEAEDARRYIEEGEFEHLGLAKSVLRERIVYRKAIRDGLSVAEYADPKTGKKDERAIEEIMGFYGEIYV